VSKDLRRASGKLGERLADTPSTLPSTSEVIDLTERRPLHPPVPDIPFIPDAPATRSPQAVKEPSGLVKPAVKAATSPAPLRATQPDPLAVSEPSVTDDQLLAWSVRQRSDARHKVSAHLLMDTWERLEALRLLCVERTHRRLVTATFVEAALAGMSNSAMASVARTHDGPQPVFAPGRLFTVAVSDEHYQRLLMVSTRDRVPYSRLLETAIRNALSAAGF
jgi:hypothetical protein